MVSIRSERPGDAAAIRAVNELVDALRDNDAPLLSFVAESEGQVVGHILFSPVTLHGDGAPFNAVGLGPLAVRPDRQGLGIGSRLVESGLEACRQAGYDAVFVLGHPTYYPRFGFVPTQPLGIRCEFDAPREAFMVIELREGAVAGRKGTVKYLPEFSAVE
jgi:putative acetyltransferase